MSVILYTVCSYRMSVDASEVREFREEFELTQAAVADLVGVDPNTVARWEQGEVSIPEPAGRLLRLLSLLAEEEGDTTSAPLDNVELLGSIFSPLAGFMAGRTTRHKARTVLHVLRIRGWRKTRRE